MKNYLTEAIGTFFLVLTIGLSDNIFAIGAVLMGVIYMGGHISGAHYNPAITVAVFMRKKMTIDEAAWYVVAQILGALVAGFIVYFLINKTFGPAIGDEYSVLQAIVAEILFTFVLALVILQVGFNPKTAGNDYYGLAIGLTVIGGAIAVGDISGAAFNPAVGIGTLLSGAILSDGNLSELWVYLVAPIIGGILAVMAYNIMSEED